MNENPNAKNYKNNFTTLKNTFLSHKYILCKKEKQFCNPTYSTLNKILLQKHHQKTKLELIHLLDQFLNMFVHQMVNSILFSLNNQMHPLILYHNLVLLSLNHNLNIYLPM